MRLFFEFTYRSLQRQMAYRAATLAGLGTNFFWGILRINVITALYQGQAQVAGLSLADAITFTGLAQATIGFLSLFGWYELMNSVYDGSVAMDLLKPMGYFRFWLAQDLGRAAGQLLLRVIPMLFVFHFFFDISLPGSLGRWAALLVSMILGWLVSFAYRFLVNLSAFWTPNALGVGRFAFAIALFTSGFMMPLRFFPDWFVRFCYALPFPSAVNTIIETYLGVLQGPALLKALAVQAAWAAVLIGLGQVVLRLGLRRLVIAGG